MLTVTLPKARVVTLGVRITVAATPVPVRLTVRGVLLALLLIDMLPEAAPVVVG